MLCVCYIVARLVTAIPLLLAALQELDDKESLTVAFPDDGAFKRFNSQFDQFPTITCVKIRDGDKRIVTVKEGKVVVFLEASR